MRCNNDPLLTCRGTALIHFFPLYSPLNTFNLKQEKTNLEREVVHFLWTLILSRKTI
jgi:hypothetical protein